MADFCNHCAKKWDFPKVDINIYAIHRRLNKNEIAHTLCEGCGLSCVKKDSNGSLKVSYYKNPLVWLEL